MIIKQLLVFALLFHLATAKSLAPGKLLELEYSQRVVHGRYQSGNGISGIEFFSQEDGYLFVSTFDHKTLIDTGPFIDVDGWKIRSVYVLGLEYLQCTNPSNSDEPIDHDHSFSETVEKLAKVKEVTLLLEAAEAVGQRGLTGKNTPAVLPFFMFALRTTQLHQSPSVGANATTGLQRRSADDACFSECPPCEDDDCYGMCGYGCHCWSWVCGDCCLHQGCYGHDTCCRDNFYQTSCLFPYGFHCDEPYTC